MSKVNIILGIYALIVLAVFVIRQYIPRRSSLITFVAIIILISSVLSMGAMPDYQQDCILCIEHHQRRIDVAFFMFGMGASLIVGDLIGWIFVSLRARLQKTKTAT